MPQTITEEEFKKAYDLVLDEMMNDEKLKGINKLFVPLLGSIFADKMKVILFDNKEEK